MLEKRAQNIQNHLPQPFLGYTTPSHRTAVGTLSRVWVRMWLLSVPLSAITTPIHLTLVGALSRVPTHVPLEMVAPF